MNGVKRLTLDNGTGVLLKKVSWTKKTFVLVGYKTGSIDETKENAGLRHLAEHMPFESKAARQTVEELEYCGAKVSAFTSLRETGFYFKVSAPLASRALRAIFQMFIKRDFSAQDFQREKKIVLDEIENGADIPAYKLKAIIFISALFGDNPLGRPIEGFFETVSKLTPDDIHGVLDNFYLPNNSKIVVVGRFEEAEILKAIEQTFGTIPVSSKTIKHSQFKIEAGNANNISIVPRPGPSHQVYLCLGYKLPNIFELKRDVFKLKVLDAVLSAGMSSRLPIALRTRRGIGYEVGTLFDDNLPASAFFAYIDGFYKKRFSSAVKAILDQFRELKNSPVDKRELEKAKNQLIAGQEDNMEELHYIAMETLKREFHGTPYDFTKIPSYIKMIKSDDVMEAAQRYLTDDYTLAALVPEGFNPFGG